MSSQRFSNRRPRRPAPASPNAATTSFVGRQAELAALHEALQRSRCVTVLGPPGIGKTRLAREYIRVHDASAAFCELADVTTAAGIVHAVSGALAIPLGPTRNRDDGVLRLGRAIRERGRLLLVLDHFEQGVAHAGATILPWLQVASELRVLATSRERCGIAGEALLDLGPLPLQSDAVQLFVDRARAVRNDFVLEGRQAEIAHLVGALDGLPLAIELAAARMRVLSPEQLLADPQLCLGPLRGAIDTSWPLLSPTERSVLAQLSVFRGRFDLDSAAQVVDRGAGPDAPPLVEILAALRDKSMLSVEEPMGRRSELRYGLLASIRDHAGEKLLETGQAAEVLRRHASHYLRRGALLAEQAHGPEAAQARQSLALERENLLAIHQRALAPAAPTGEQVATALQAAVALGGLYLEQGPLDEYVALLSAALGRADGLHVPLETLARALAARAEAQRGCGRMEEGEADFEAALELARRSGNAGLQGRILDGVGMQGMARGRLSFAAGHFEQALLLLEQAGDRPFEAYVSIHLGHLEIARRRYPEARRWFDHARRVARRLAHPGIEGRALGGLGRLAQEQDRLAEARDCYGRALRLERAAGDSIAETVTLGWLAIVDHLDDRLDDARLGYERTIDQARRIGHRWLEGMALGYLGLCHLDAARADESAACCDAACQIGGEMGNASYEALWLGHTGAVRAHRGDVVGAGETLDEACARLDALRNQTFRAAIDLLRGHVDLALARQARMAGDGDAASRHVLAARARAERFRAGGAGGERAAGSAVEVRLVAASLERALHRPAGAGGWIIDSAGRWFRPPRGKRVSLQRRAPLSRLLARLVEHRRAAAGDAVALDALFDAGWPGEKALPHAAAQRVYTALWTLRKLGLGDVIVRAGGGYLLDPELPVQTAGKDDL